MFLGNAPGNDRSTFRIKAAKEGIHHEGCLFPQFHYTTSSQLFCRVISPVFLLSHMISFLAGMPIGFLLMDNFPQSSAQ